MEEDRLQAASPATVGEHIGSVKAVLDRHRIRNPAQMLTIDEVGCSFGRQTGRALRRGIIHASEKTTATVSGMKVKGKLNHFPAVVNIGANGTPYKPLVVFPGKQTHF